ncbi:zinc finger protein, putative [Bodo saltans]|uniref:Zinc finger protein, putative n=1 Tax=Bodo saltans TaxID=75058 RepID=A0A0S4JCN1_BODSA|nr:zinc finger protein, putative [Bodo saltans]|eukprot:CUG87769.1 zinc finger protein, putative [Bodo saltans]
MSELFPYAQMAQIPRNGIIALLSDPNIVTILKGSYVRVLLELPEHREDYHLARIDGVEHSDEPYCGFSQVVGQYTTVLLRLQLPRALTGINGTLYQLNSISNSTLNAQEFDGWVAQTSGEFFLPTVQELMDIHARIAPFIIKRNAGAGAGGGAAAAASQQSQLSNKPSFAARALPAGGTAQPSALGSTKKDANKNASSPRANGGLGNSNGGGAVNIDDELPTRSQVHHQILNELRDKDALFPINTQELKTSLLRLTERDLFDYLENVRSAIIAKRSVCVVCMDQVASVIMLPCKHKVLCRLCAPSVSSCPCCREVALELFEPVEI